MQYEPEQAVDISEQPMDEIKKEKDPKLSILLTQISLCSIALLVALSLMFVGGDTYIHAKEMFDKYFDQQINISQVLGKEGTETVTTAAPTESYGMGGEFDDTGIPYFESYEEASASVEIADSDANKMEVPVLGEVTSEYGWRIHPISGKRSFHTGVDIGAPTGTEIKSALDGIVTKTVKNDPDYGNYIVVSHGDDAQTMYAHCSKLTKKKGDTVSKGECIAYVGSTGLSTGPHLHFEVRIGGSRLDPRWFITI